MGKKKNTVMSMPVMSTRTYDEYTATCVVCGQKHSRTDWDNTMSIPKSGFMEMHCHKCRQTTQHTNVTKSKREW